MSVEFNAFTLLVSRHANVVIFDGAYLTPPK